MASGFNKCVRVATVCFDAFLSLTGYLAGLITVFMMIIVTIEVVMRYFFNRPSQWVIDIATLGIPFITLLAVAWVLRENKHVTIDIVYQWVSPRKRAKVELITSVVTFLACILFLYQSWVIFYEAYEWKEELFRSIVIPKTYVLWPFPFGALLLCIQFVRRIRKNFYDCRQYF
ncbi:MAG: TRAP transporter small permease [Deltaproteobacteria bacterium]|nr:TRAP transporter small permease [Deltaproteobacteria bacterium]